MQSDKVQRGRHGLSCLSEKPSLSGLPLLAARKAVELAALFETLANDTRLRVLNVMVQGTETSPTELVKKIGMKPQAISNQLKRLSDRGIVERRREGQSGLSLYCRPVRSRSVGTGFMAYSRCKAAQSSQERKAHRTA